MNDLLAKSFVNPMKGAGEYVDLKKDAARDVEMGLGGQDMSLAAFFEEVSSVKTEMEKVRELLGRLQGAHEESKRAHKAQDMKDLRERMDSDVGEVLRKAKAIKAKLEDMDGSNHANRTVAGCGVGTPFDRTRSSITNSLRMKLKELMGEFQALREKMLGEYRETVKRRFYTVTGQEPDADTVDRIIDTGESEGFLHKAIQEQGRGQVLDTILEIQERHDAVKEIERNLLELHQIFMDMAVLVEAQGEQLNDIEHYVSQANAYIDKGAHQLKYAKQYQRNTRKWLIFAIIFLLLLILVVVIPLATSFKSSS